MAEYTDREELRAAMQHIFNDPACPMHIAAEIEQIIDCAPAADVAPVVHGQWIRPHWKNNNYCCDCSECGGEAMHRDYQWDKNGVYPICPNCGAKMDGGDSDAVD